MRNDVVRVSKSEQFRIICYEGMYAIQKHYPNGWRDCIDSIYTDDLDDAIQELNVRETEFIKSKDM